MSAGTYNIKIDQGATFSLRTTMKEDGSVKDLTSPQYYGRAQLRKLKEDSSATVAFTVTGTGAGVLGSTTALGNDGIIDMGLSASQTASLTAGSYFYDLEISTVSADNSGQVTRLLQGKAEVTREITR